MSFSGDCSCVVFFFFSSRRRHTRCRRDWSSDVCSSDLPLAVSDEGLTWLVAERWPGNARELEHAIERAAVLSDKEILEPADFRPHPPSPSPQRGEGRSEERRVGKECRSRWSPDH